MNLIPRLWTTSQDLTSDPFRAMRLEMENAFRAFGQNLPSADIGAGAPAISVAETKDAYEVTAEFPGVDEKDIKVSLDEKQLVISSQFRAESPQKRERDWHVEERELRLHLPIDVPAIRARGRSRRCSFRQRRAASYDPESLLKAIKTTKTIGDQDERRTQGEHRTEQGCLVHLNRSNRGGMS